MKIFALADLHLCVSCPEKNMSKFGPKWHGYMERIATEWTRLVSDEDCVLVAGDICWAMRGEQAREDLAWLAKLPGRKVLIRGNHDYWWPSKSKLKALLPSGILSAQVELVELSPSVAVVGTRLWDTSEYSFDAIIDWQPPIAGVSVAKQGQVEGQAQPPEAPLESGGTTQAVQDEAIFNRELLRLEEALKLFGPQHTTRLVMVHYPPIGLELAPSQASSLLERYGVHTCVFGHLHSLLPTGPIFGKARGVDYRFTAYDYLKGAPDLIMEL